MSFSDSQMDLAILLLCLVAAPGYVHSSVQLVESGPGTVSPGGSFKLTCKVTGDSITDVYWAWIRQAPGKGLEWVGRIDWDGSKWRTVYASSLQSRTTLTADDSRNEYYLTMRSLTAADSATYYCARMVYSSTGWASYYFDIWGKGTSVVVSTESPKAPSLFPLIPSGDNSGAKDITIGCLAKNFLPDSITFSWNDTNHQSISSQNYVKFPSILSGGTYTTASQAKVPRDAWERYEKFYCQADHPKGKPTIPVVRQNVGPLPREPGMLIRAPIVKAFSSSYLNSTVTCEVSDLCSPNIELRWLKEQREITTGITTSKPVPNSHGGYTIWSQLVITKEDWLSEKKFTCDVKSKAFNRSETFSVLSFCKDVGPCLDVTVETIPPTFADMYLTNSANLTCRISNIPPGSDYLKLNVTWTRASDHKQLPTVMTNFLDQANDLYYVDAIATVCATEWNEKESYTCKVAFEDVLVKPVEKSLQKEIVDELKAPLVYVLSPSIEELNLREKVTLTCLIKHFNPGNLFVRWLQNEQPVSESTYFTSKPIAESKVSSKEHFAYSMLNVNEQEWSAGDSFTCVVGHEALPFQSIQKTINKNTGKPSIVNVSLVLSDASSPCY